MRLVRTRNALLVCTFLVALQLGGTLPAQEAVDRISPQSFEGQTVIRYEFPKDQPLDLDDLRNALESSGVKKGAPLDEAAVRSAIQHLFATGRFTDIKVDAEPAPGGVILHFETRNAWFIGDVSVEGKVGEPPNLGQLSNATGLDLGTPFDASLLGPAEDGIRKLLTADGYYGATITHRLDYQDAQQVDITFRVEAGKRAHYTDPKIVGTNLVLTPARIIRSTGWHRFLVPGWRGVTQKRTNQGAQNVRVRYEKANRLLATVTLSKLDYNAALRVVQPTLTVDPGLSLEIKTIGKKIGKGEIKSNVPIYDEHTVDRDLLQEGANNLRDELQAAGYFDAQVEYREPRAVSDKEEIDYVITPGPRSRLVALTVTGNRYFRTPTIRERMFLEPKSIQFFHGRFSNEFLRRDKESISSLYQANGFRDVAVTSRISQDYKGKKGDIAVAITIDEGKQWIVNKLSVEGYSKLDLHRIISTLNSSADQPFSDFNIAADREQILNYYFQNGFPTAEFSWTSTPGSKPNLVNLTYSLKEGNQQFVRRVIYEGLHAAKARLVDKQITLNPGDPLSAVSMGETQRRLYDLGIFAKVDMAVQNADGEGAHKYVLYDMEEASRWNLTGGLGAEIARIGGSSAANDLSNPGGATGFSPRVEVDVTRLDLLGLGQTLALRSQYSSYDKRAELTYLLPRILDRRNLDLTISTLYDDSYDVRTFADKREEVSAQLTDRISKATTAFFRFSYRNVSVSNLKINPLLVPLLSSPTRTGLVAVNLVNDRRDDPTDAHRGIYDSIDFGVASHYLGGRNNFLRILGRNATFTKLFPKLLLARQTSFGILPTFGKAPTLEAGDEDPIPLAERFFGGGPDTLRGFPQNQAGTRDMETGFPLGGSVLLYNNTELRFPLIGDNIGGVIFEDFGNLFDRPGDISFSFSQPHPSNPTDFNYMVHDAGFGIRYKTPIGPIRLDLAYSINPPKYYGFAGSFEDLVNCTASNTCTRELLQISHFQFFFSIGQTF
jgi:outer membrane protein assembly complex protein YaeT